MSDNKDLNQRFDQLEKRLDSLVAVNPYSPFQPSGLESEEIDLRELWNILWCGKWIIVAVTFLFAVVSVFYALSLPNIYKSEALLAPAEENASGGLARMAGGLGGLASLAGVNLGGSGSDKTTIAIEVLKSREFISKFIQNNNLLVPLMAAKGWDRAHDKLILDDDIYDEVNKKWVRESKPPRTAKPSLQEGYKAFIDILSVSQDKETGFVSVSIEHYCPSIAKNWVDLLVENINAEIKHRDVIEAVKSIQYLSQQLEKTSISDMQAVFYELIEEQTKTAMFAEVRDEYVFKTIDKAIAPEKKVKPNKPLICFLGAILGGVLGLVFVLIFYFSKKNDE